MTQPDEIRTTCDVATCDRPATETRPGALLCTQCAGFEDALTAALMRPAAGRAFTRPSVEPRLTDEGLIALLDEADATGDQRAAIGEHRASLSGRHKPWTRTYVLQWLEGYLHARDAGATPDEAIGEAVNLAANVVALGDAATAGTQPISRPALITGLRGGDAIADQHALGEAFEDALTAALMRPAAQGA